MGRPIEDFGSSIRKVASQIKGVSVTCWRPEKQDYLVVAGQLYRKSAGKLTSKGSFQFNAEFLPGCCGVLVISYPHESGEDCGFLQLLEDAAKDAKFGMILFSQRLESPLVGKLKEQGYSVSPSFTNGLTGNELVLAALDLKQTTEPKPKPYLSE